MRIHLAQCVNSQLGLTAKWTTNLPVVGTAETFQEAIELIRKLENAADFNEQGCDFYLYHNPAEIWILTEDGWRRPDLW